MADINYSMVSVPRKTANAGRPQPRLQHLIFFDFNDVAEYERDAKGVKISKFTLKAGKKPIGVYHTASTGNVYDKLDGEDDAKGYIHHVEFEHPGNEIEFLEFKENCANARLGVISVPCDSTALPVIAGFPCCPLKLTEADGQNSSTGNKQTIKLATQVRKSVLGIIEKILIPATDNPDINAELGIVEKEGV